MHARFRKENFEEKKRRTEKGPCSSILRGYYIGVSSTHPIADFRSIDSWSLFCIVQGILVLHYSTDNQENNTKREQQHGGESRRDARTHELCCVCTTGANGVDRNWNKDLQNYSFNTDATKSGQNHETHNKRTTIYYDFKYPDCRSHKHQST